MVSHNAVAVHRAAWKTVPRRGYHGLMLTPHEALELRHLSAVAGGSINTCYRGELSDGRAVFLKENPSAPADFFAAEKAGLEALRDAGAPVPEVLDCGREYLLLGWVETAMPLPGAMEQLGRALAEVHEHRGPAFGFHMDNYCGLTPQENRQYRDGFRFFAECRLLPQGRRARDQGLLDSEAVSRLESLCRRLPERIPEQPPSLIHGDLWAGNVIFDTDGEPVLIDPAVSWSQAEADLAMTRLFGGFGEAFYSAYEIERPLEPGFGERVPIYNLYHLLNHLNLFGSAYKGSVLSILRNQ